MVLAVFATDFLKTRSKPCVGFEPFAIEDGVRDLRSRAAIMLG